MDVFMASLKGLLGYESFGYWYFLAEDDAGKLLEDNISSLLSILLGTDRSQFKENFMDIGGLKAALQRQYETPLRSYITDEDRRRFIKEFGAGGSIHQGVWSRGKHACCTELLLNNGQ